RLQNRAKDLRRHAGQRGENSRVRDSGVDRRPTTEHCDKRQNALDHRLRKTGQKAELQGIVERRLTRWMTAALGGVELRLLGGGVGVSAGGGGAPANDAIRERPGVLRV